MKKILAIAIVAIMMLQASVIFAADITAYKFKPEIDGIISEGEYPAESTFRVDKALMTERGGHNLYNDYDNDNMPDDLYFDMSYAWDEENLYMAVVAIDKSPVKAQHWDLTGGNGGTAGRADGIQLNTFVDQIFGRWFMITVAEDGTLYTCGIYNQFPDTDERQNLTSICPGKGAWNENGFSFEIAIPWEVVKYGNHLAEHSDDENEHVDEYYYIPWLTSGYEIEEGLEMAVTVCYQDVDANQNRGRYANDNFHNNPDADGIRDFVILAGEKPAVDTGSDDQGTTDTGSDDQGTTDTGSDDQGTTDTGSDDQGTTDTGSDDQGTTDTGSDDQGTTDDGADTGVDTGDDAAQTFDFGVIALVAAVVSAAAMLLKKKR